MSMDVIHELIEEGEVKKAMNVITRQDKIRADGVRLGQALIIHAQDEMKKEREGITEKEVLDYLYNMEDRHLLKLMLEKYEV